MSDSTRNLALRNLRVSKTLSNTSRNNFNAAKRCCAQDLDLKMNAAVLNAVKGDRYWVVEDPPDIANVDFEDERWKEELGEECRRWML